MGYPICVVEIHGQQESYELQAGVSPNSVPSGDLISVQTTKRLSPESPAGIFDLVLARRRDATGRTWMDKIRPQDTVVIQMMNYQGGSSFHGAGEMHTVMIGYVDRVTDETVLSPEGKPTRAIRVRGRDAGKLFITGITTYWSFAGASVLKGTQYVDPSIFDDRPNRIIARLLDYIFSRMLKLQFLTEGHLRSWFDLLAYRLESFGPMFPGGSDHHFLGGEGSFWSFFTEVASLPFHELWVDTRRASDLANLTPNDNLTLKTPRIRFGRDQSCTTLFLRPTPFPYLLPSSAPAVATAGAPPSTTDGSVVLQSVVSPTVSRVDRSAWDSLLWHVLGPEDLILGEPMADQMSRSDEEQFNFFFLFPVYKGLDRSHYLLNVPIIVDETNYRRFGYRPFMPSTRLLNFEGVDNGRDAMVGFYTALAWRLASWNVLNNQFLSGTKTCQLLPHIHVGERLFDRSGSQPPTGFYIEGVTHIFVQNERAMTVLGLTRGLPTEQYNQYGQLLLNADLTDSVGIEVRDYYRKLVEQNLPQGTS